MNPHIKNALLNGRLVLLLGAGASRGSKNKLNEDIPLGGELARLLANEMGEEYNNEDLSEVYSAAKSVLGSQVHRLFEKHYKHCSPSSEYIDILKYPFFRIYSLNIDDSFENAAIKHGNRVFNVKHRTDNISEVDQFYKTLDYIKLNGDVNKLSEGVIFSAQEYASGSVKEPLWYSELAKDYHKYTFIFIGTQLKEPLFNHQIEKYKAKTSSTDLKSYVLIPSLTKIQQTSLEASNIHHIPGKLSDFTSWLESEFETPPTSDDLISNTRPELKDENKLDNKHIRLFSGVTPVNRSSLALLEKTNNKSKIRNFYKGFKPSWFDILEEVPAFLTNTLDFYQKALIDNKSKALDLHIIFGTAGSGKSTSLKQLALKVADEGSRNVYFIEEYKDRFQELISELDHRNNNNYYVFIERVGGVALELSEIINGGKSSKAIFISCENTKIWHSRVEHHLSDVVTSSINTSKIKDSDADLILSKLQKYGHWTRLAKLSKANRKIELLRKAKSQLLIGLIEATSGEGYNKIIQKDYNSITCESEKALLILAGLATTHRVPANESTLTRALYHLGLNPNVHYLSSKMEGLVSFRNGEVTTRHRVYIEKLFTLFIPQKELLKIICAYLESFSVYDFPIVKSISKSEFTIYKHLVNNKSLGKVLNNNKNKVLSVYERFEKAFENEGLFLMQYGLALRSFGKNEDAYEKLRIAQQAYPDSPQIEHALAQQRIVLACKENDETIALALFGEAETVLNRLNNANISAGVDAFDRYPIITLSEGHVKVMDNLGYKAEAKVLARHYYDRINKIKNSHTNDRLKQTIGNLMKYFSTGNWPEKRE